MGKGSLQDVPQTRLLGLPAVQESGMQVRARDSPTHDCHFPRGISFIGFHRMQPLSMAPHYSSTPKANETPYSVIPACTGSGDSK